LQYRAKRNWGNEDDVGLEETGKGRVQNSGQIIQEDDHA